jgi:phosphoglycolate phosphatase
MSNSQERTVKAVAFDFDGTLIDSAPDLQAAINRVLTWAGRKTLDVESVKGMVGDGVQKLVERALEATGGVPDADSVETLAKWVSRFLDEYQGHDADLTHAYDGVHATLEQLKADGYRLAVCTNKPQAATISILDALGLAGFFDAVLGGDVIEGVRKPDPKHLLATLAALDVTPGQAVMVGDHLNDLACARAAGAPAILCSYGYSRVPVSELGADAVIERFEDLPAVIASLS